MDGSFSLSPSSSAYGCAGVFHIISALYLNDLPSKIL